MWICRLEKKDKARAHGRDGQPREGQDPSTGEGGPDKRGITQAHGSTGALARALAVRASGLRLGCSRFWLAPWLLELLARAFAVKASGLRLGC